MGFIRRKLIEMSRAELKSVVGLIEPSRKGDETLSRDQLREIVIKWLFANEMTLNHQFELIREGNQIVCLVKSLIYRCDCCRKQKDENGNAQKIQVEEKEESNVVTVQPTIIKIDYPEPIAEGISEQNHDEKHAAKFEKTTIDVCKRECGWCIVQICLQI